MTRKNQQLMHSYRLDGEASIPSRGCFSSFVKGNNRPSRNSLQSDPDPNGSFQPDDSEHYNPNNDSSNISHGSSNKSMSLYNSLYGLLDKHHVANNESFQTAGTGRTEGSIGSKTNKSSKVRSRVNVICGLKPSSHKGHQAQSSRNNPNRNGEDTMDTRSCSQRSQVGLLDNESRQGDSAISSSSFDGRSWKTAKSSGASSSSISESQLAYGHGPPRPYATIYNEMEENGAFPSFPNSSFETPEDEIPKKQLSRKGAVSHAFKGCVQIRKKKDATRHKREEQSNPHVNSLSRRDSRTSSSNTDTMPHIPEGAHYPKFNTSIVTEDENFSQIIFVNDEEGRSDFENDGGTPTRNVRDPNVHPFSTYEMSRQAQSASHARNHNNQQYDYGVTKGSNPNLTMEYGPPPDQRERLNRSPIKSPREFKHEEHFLDTLANTLTTNYNTLQENIHQLTGKPEFQRLMGQGQQHGSVPKVVDFGLDQSDLVSEFDMGSTSGGKYNNNIMPKVKEDSNDYGPKKSVRRMTNYSSSMGRPPQAPKLTRRAPTPPEKFDNSERFQYAGYDNDETDQSPADRRNLPRRSLFDQDEDDNEPRMSRSPRCKTPLALSEAFEKFGIDDRLFSGRSNPGNAFDFDQSDDEEEGEREFGQAPAYGRVSPPHQQQNVQSIENMPSPTKIGLSPRRRKYDSSGSWREERRATNVKQNKLGLEGPTIERDRTDALSEVSSSISQITRRSDKYHGMIGLPSKSTTLDRQISGGSAQTQQWSNTGASKNHSSPYTNRQTSRLPPVNDEEALSNYSSASLAK